MDLSSIALHVEHAITRCELLAARLMVGVIDNTRGIDVVDRFRVGLPVAARAAQLRADDPPREHRLPVRMHDHPSLAGQMTDTVAYDSLARGS